MSEGSGRQAVRVMRITPSATFKERTKLESLRKRDKVISLPSMSASKGHRCFFPQILSFLEIIHYEPDMYKLANVSLTSALTLSSLVRLNGVP